MASLLRVSFCGCDLITTDFIQYQIFLANRSSLSGLGDSVLPIFNLGRRLTASKFLGDTATSRANNSAHYDLSNNLYVILNLSRYPTVLTRWRSFSAFLSEDMNYSSALFMDFNEDLKSDVTKRETLEEAQLRRMRWEHLLHTKLIYY